MLEFLLALKVNLTPVKVQTQPPTLIAGRTRGYMNRAGQNVASNYCKKVVGNHLTGGPDGNGIFQCGNSRNGGVGVKAGRDFGGVDFYVNNEGGGTNNYNMQDACEAFYPAGYTLKLRNGKTIRLNQSSFFQNGGCYADDIEFY